MDIKVGTSSTKTRRKTRADVVQERISVVYCPCLLDYSVLSTTCTSRDYCYPDGFCWHSFYSSLLIELIARVSV